MMATWFQGGVDAFVRASQEGFANGVRMAHFLGGTSIECAGKRAIAPTKMTISQRAAVHGVLCDGVCTGRCYDFFEKRKSRSWLVLRQPIYERDRIDAVDPAARLVLDRALFERFPAGYRHLAYLQTLEAAWPSSRMPALRGPELDALLAEGRAWLDGKPFRGPLEEA